WLRNDTILVGGFSGIEAVAANSGSSNMIGLKDSTSARIGQRWPLVLPGGRYVIYAASNNSAAVPRLAVLDLQTKQAVFHELAMAVPLGFLEGHLVYVSTGGATMAVAFDLGSRRPIGDPVAIEDGIVIDPTGGAKAALSASGTLMYLKGRAEYQLVLTNSASAPTPLMGELRLYSSPRYSPDGRRVAVTVLNPRSADVWIYDLEHNTFTQLTTEGSNVRPEWTPDGK